MFWGTIFVLCLVYSFTVGACYVWGSQDPTLADTGLGLAFAVGSVASCMSFGLLVLAVRLCRWRGWAPRGRWRTAAWCLALLPLLLILLDSPPIWHDHSWSDLPSPKKDAEESDRCFRQLLATNGPALRVAAPHLGTPEIETNSLMYVAEIEGVWGDIRERRTLIKKLNAFDGIDEKIEIPRSVLDVPAFNFVGLRDVAQVYWAYAHLKIVEGNAQEAVAQLAELHSVVRKALPYAKTLVRKMLLIGIAGKDIETAYRIAEDPRCTPQVMAAIQDAFPRLVLRGYGHSKLPQSAGGGVKNEGVQRFIGAGATLSSGHAL